MCFWSTAAEDRQDSCQKSRKVHEMNDNTPSDGRFIARTRSSKTRAKLKDARIVAARAHASHLRRSRSSGVNALFSLLLLLSRTQVPRSKRYVEREHAASNDVTVGLNPLRKRLLAGAVLRPRHGRTLGGERASRRGAGEGRWRGGEGSARYGAGERLHGGGTVGGGGGAGAGACGSEVGGRCAPRLKAVAATAHEAMRRAPRGALYMWGAVHGGQHARYSRCNGGRGHSRDARGTASMYYIYGGVCCFDEARRGARTTTTSTQMGDWQMHAKQLDRSVYYYSRTLSVIAAHDVAHAHRFSLSRRRRLARVRVDEHGVERHGVVHLPVSRAVHVALAGRIVVQNGRQTVRVIAQRVQATAKRAVALLLHVV
ncbi:hypothetical protein FGB62_29g114 [Gracilaria domingensis]|nr:hypothetical protein FGB62_29g114 [Gracilaria domingensis]